MNSILKLVLVNFVYPLARDFAQWVYNKYLLNRAESKRKEIVAQKKALKQSIKQAKNDEQIKQLSIILHNISNQ